MTTAEGFAVAALWVAAIAGCCLCGALAEALRTAIESWWRKTQGPWL